jgi:hypothetical protein
MFCTIYNGICKYIHIQHGHIQTPFAKHMQLDCLPLRVKVDIHASHHLSYLICYIPFLHISKSPKVKFNPYMK